MLTEEEKKEKRRLHNQRYREENRASINARVRARKLQKRIGKMPDIDQQINITKKEIAKLIGVKMLTLEKILKDKKYSAPKHTELHFDGTVLFNRSEIMEWMPYAREACAFIKKGKQIKLTGMAASIVHFMHRNKETELICNEIRRKKLIGRGRHNEKF
jgi:predicted DNA-binding transcriptional regulator AlpA